MYAGADDPSTVDIEKECSPQIWSKDPNILKTHLDVTISESKRVRKLYKNSKFNVPYGPSPMETYDIYFKGEENFKPIFIYVHGGYWQRATKEVSCYCVAPLVENGYKVIIIDYNLCPAVTLETMIEQVKAGMEKILTYAFNSKAPEVTICGHSAGGHLVSAILDTDYTHKDLVKHFVLISGVFDITETWDTKACSSISGVENPLRLNQVTAKKCSPMYYSKFAKFPADFHLLTGKYESPSFFGLSKAFKKVLENNHFKVTQYEFPNYDHFDIVHSMKDTHSEIMIYLFKVLGLSVKNKL